jgi:hypothetical protein
VEWGGSLGHDYVSTNVGPLGSGNLALPLSETGRRNLVNSLVA